MFTLPPWPPKDYVLLPVSKAQQSSSVLTPFAKPRSTQTNIGKYLYPIFYKDSEKVKPEIKDVHPIIVEKWLQRSKAWWIEEPGRTNFHKMVSLAKGDDRNNPTYQHKEKVFNRPFSLEADCIEYMRLKKLQEKSDRESEEKCNYITGLQQAQILKQTEEEALNVSPCNLPTPFWWKAKDSGKDKKIKSDESAHSDVTEEKHEFTSPKFWQEPPSASCNLQDPCIRRKELLMVGLPFQNEACNWYYKNYPPPKITFRPQRFS